MAALLRGYGGMALTRWPGITNGSFSNVTSMWSKLSHNKTHFNNRPSSEIVRPVVAPLTTIGHKVNGGAYVGHGVLKPVSRPAGGWLLTRPYDSTLGLTSVHQYSTLPECRIVKCDVAESHVTVFWRPLEETSDVPFVWLRDNCQCDKCLNRGGDRTQLLADLAIEIKPRKLQTSNDLMKVTWEDGHVSDYTADWLFKFRFASDEQHVNMPPLVPEIRLWDEKFLEEPPKLKFEDVLRSDDHLLQWFNNVEVHGMCILEEATTDTSMLYKLSERIGKPMEFPVRRHYDAKNVAGRNEHVITLSGRMLELHTDLGMNEHTNWVTAQHCISQNQTEGGVSEFSDGFKAALLLRAERPDYFELLTKQVTYNWNYQKGLNFNSIHCAPIIRLNCFGEPCQIVFSPHYRSPLLALPADQVAAFYAAMKTFYQILRRSENLLRFKMTEGDMVCVNNYRLLHGRTAWEDSDSGSRHIILMLFDREELISRRRLLSLGEKMF